MFEFFFAQMNPKFGNCRAVVYHHSLEGVDLSDDCRYFGLGDSLEQPVF